MMRIVLFAATNVAVLFVLTIIMRVFGLEQALAGSGTNLTGLLIFSAIFGMSGALISLFMSKTMAKRAVGAHIIDQPANEVERWLVDTVARQAEAAGIGMPEVALYEAPEPNAFATGANRNNALVAVSTGLLRAMSREEAEAVLGHEVAHVANGDMVTLTLLQGVLNTFVIFLSRVLGQVIDRAVFKSERGYGPGYFIVSLVLQVVLGVLATIVVRWFSRYREFRADAGGARLTSREAMASALERLKAGSQASELPEGMQAFGINTGKLAGLFSTHPPLDDRIRALREAG